MLNIFNSDAFSIVRLTQVINDMVYKPGRIGQLGLFGTDSVDTTSIAIEKQGDLLTLVAPTARGGPGITIAKERSDMRSLIVPHFEINDAIMAEEVQGRRAIGTENQLETVIGKVARRLQIHVASHAATEEYSRMGAIQGIVNYANHPDGSTTTPLNLFTEFGVAAFAEVPFDLANVNPADGVLRKLCAVLTRTVTDTLGGVGFDYIHSFCGDNFFDSLLQHKELRDTYKGWNEAQILRDSYLGPNRTESYGMVKFGGIVFENYRGTVGSTTFVGTDACHMFPVGIPDLFKSVYAPADYNETVNTLGERLYAKQFPMPNDKGVHLDSQTNALQYCSRPKVLIKGRRGV